MIVGLSANVFDFFPRTSVVQISRAAPLEIRVINGFVDELRRVYDEEDLVILFDYNDTNDFLLTFNGRTILNSFRNEIQFGQPILGEMNVARYDVAPFYIHAPTFDGTTVSYIIKDALDGDTFTNLNVKLYIVDIATNVIAHTQAATINIPNDGMDSNHSHTITSTWDPDDYKAVITILDANGNIVQSASTERVLKSFRVVKDPMDRDFSVIGAIGAEFSNFGKFYVFNMDFDSTEADVRIYQSIEGVTLTSTSFQFTFCDEESCFFLPWNILFLPRGTISSYYYSTIHRHGGSGYAKLTMSLYEIDSSNQPIDSYLVVIPMYYTTPDVDILIIMDDAGESRYDIEDSALFEYIEYMSFSFGIFKPELANLSKYRNLLRNHIHNYIWYASAMYTAMGTDEIVSLSDIVSGKRFLAMGQNLAHGLANSHKANEQTLGFLHDKLLSDFVSGYTSDTTITGVENTFAVVLAFELISTIEYIYAHRSTNSIEPRLSDALFIDGDDNIKGVFGRANDIGGVVFLDFDIESIDCEEDAFDVVFWCMYWLFNQGVSDSDVTISTRPVSVETYPNPVSGILNIHYTPQKTTVSEPDFAIYNIRGQRLHTGTLSRSAESYTRAVDINNLNLSSGIYFIRVNDAGEQNVKKFLILR
jgi:hypothetical protein